MFHTASCFGIESWLIQADGIVFVIHGRQFSSDQFIYLPLRNTWKEAKKSNYLDSHGEEVQKKPAGLWRMGSLR